MFRTPASFMFVRVLDGSRSVSHSFIALFGFVVVVECHFFQQQLLAPERPSDPKMVFFPVLFQGLKYTGKGKIVLTVTGTWCKLVEKQRRQEELFSVSQNKSRIKTSIGYVLDLF